MEFRDIRSVLELLMSVLIAVQGVEISGGEQKFVEMPENTNVKKGEDVFLRCVVQNQQGKVQWTKDGFALGFERDVPGYPRYSYSGDSEKGEHHLVIQGATLEDDGEYQCQVGPTATTQSIWTAANVTIIVPPKWITISDSKERKIIEVVEGKALPLTCTVDDARPAASIQWLRGDSLISEDLYTEKVELSPDDQNWSVSSQLVISPSANDNNVQYSCQAVHPSLNNTSNPLVDSVTLSVRHAPSPPTITGYMTNKIVKEGDEVNLVCQSIGGNPDPKLTWYRDGRRIQSHQTKSINKSLNKSQKEYLNHDYKSRNESMHKDNKSYDKSQMESQNIFMFKSSNKDHEVSWTSSISLQVTAKDNKAVYECRTTNTVLEHPLSSSVNFNVHYGPNKVIINGPKEAALEQELTFFCVSSPSNPPAALTFIVQGIEVKPSTSEVREVGGRRKERGGAPARAESLAGADSGKEIGIRGWVTSAHLNYVLQTSFDLNQVKVECRASNAKLNSDVIEGVFVDMIIPPGEPELQLEVEGDLLSTRQLNILCTSRGGNPNPGITIFKDEKILASEALVDGGESRLQVTSGVTASDNGAMIACHVMNKALLEPLIVQHQLEIFFPPWKSSSWSDPRTIEAGHDVLLVCESSSSFPKSRITWKSGYLILRGAKTFYSTGIYGGTITRSELEVRATVNDNGKIFTCEVDNGLGITLSSNITLDVLHGPIWILTPEDRVEVIEKQDLILSAIAQANPSPVSYTWWQGPVVLESLNDEVNSSESHLEIRRIHRQESGEYSVTASSSSGTTVNASFVIDVLYGPENIVAAERVTIDVNGSAVVSCSGVGNPVPNITWVRQNDNNTDGEVLSWGIKEANLFIENAKISDTGFYYCSASNVVANPPSVSTAVVVSRAPEHLQENEYINSARRPWAKIGGTGRLECSVSAVPAPIFRWTLGDDRVLFNNRKYFIRIPKLVDGLVIWISVLEIRNVTIKDYTTYTCTASNSKGSAVSNHSLGPPVPPPIPLELNVTSVMGSTVILSWIPAVTEEEESFAAGYNIRYQSEISAYKNLGQDNENFLYANVPTGDVSIAEIKDLVPGAVYLFAIQSYNNEGKSNYSFPPTVFKIPGVVEEVASSSSQPKVPRITLVLMAFIGGALVILNISIIFCIVRRFAFRRSTPDMFPKQNVPGVYTCASIPGVDGNEGKDRDDTFEPVSSHEKQHECIHHTCVKNEDTKVILTASTETLDTDALSSISLAKQFMKNIPPDVQSDVSQGNAGQHIQKDLTLIPQTVSLDQIKTSEKNNQLMPEYKGTTNDNNTWPSDIPDVCPKSPGSTDSKSNLNVTEEVCNENDKLTRITHQSTPTYPDLTDHDNVNMKIAQNNLYHQRNTDSPISAMQSPPSESRISLSSSSTNQSSSTVQCHSEPTSQLLYHEPDYNHPGQEHCRQYFSQLEHRVSPKTVDFHSMAGNIQQQNQSNYEQEHTNYPPITENPNSINYQQNVYSVEAKELPLCHHLLESSSNLGRCDDQKNYQYPDVYQQQQQRQYQEYPVHQHGVHDSNSNFQNHIQTVVTPQHDHIPCQAHKKEFTHVHDSEEDSASGLLKDNIRLFEDSQIYHVDGYYQSSQHLNLQRQHNHDQYCLQYPTRHQSGIQSEIKSNSLPRIIHPHQAMRGHNQGFKHQTAHFPHLMQSQNSIPHSHSEYLHLNHLKDVCSQHCQITAANPSLQCIREASSNSESSKQDLRFSSQYTEL